MDVRVKRKTRVKCPAGRAKGISRSCYKQDKISRKGLANQVRGDHNIPPSLFYKIKNLNVCSAARFISIFLPLNKI